MELTEYKKRAHELFERLQDKLDAYEDELDYDFGYSKLTVRFEDQPGVVYVINTQQAALQIWVAGEALAWHFDWQAESEQWFDSKNQVELIALLQEKFQKLTGTRIDL